MHAKKCIDKTVHSLCYSECPQRRAFRKTSRTLDSRLHGNDQDGEHASCCYQSDGLLCHAGRVIWCLIGLISVFVLGSMAFAQSLDATKTGVVKITTKTGQVGTGFIVRVEPEVVYIITAAHVIAGDNQPEVEFFTKRNVPVKGAVLPGAELSDDLRGLALVVVRESANIPTGVNALPFGSVKDLVSGGEDALVIGHSGGGGNWGLAKRLISNRRGRDISLDPGVASRFSGAPIIVNDKVVGIVMSNRDGFGLGITHKSVLNYMEGFGVVPSTVPMIVAKEPSSTAKPLAPPVHVTPPSKPPNQSLPQTKTGKDGAPMVLVPEGEFWLGSDPDEVCEWDSTVKYDICLPERNADYAPRHRVKIDAFYLDAHETAVEQFANFVEETGYISTIESKGKQYAVVEGANLLFGKSWQSDTVEEADWRYPMGRSQTVSDFHIKLPVVQVSWFDAHQYCQWTGKRLPTEAEWEYAARAGTSTKHWWGNVEPTEQVGNIPDVQFRSIFSGNIKFEKVDDGFARSAPVGSFPPNPWGLFDMAGNVWEWTSDWYDPRTYFEKTQRNPTGPAKGNEKVKRGGSWFSYKELKVRSSQPPEDSDDRTGFRCAQDALQEVEAR